MSDMAKDLARINFDDYYRDSEREKSVWREEKPHLIASREHFELINKHLKADNKRLRSAMGGINILVKAALKDETT